jgi:hypothetical protein
MPNSGLRKAKSRGQTQTNVSHTRHAHTSQALDTPRQVSQGERPTGNRGSPQITSAEGRERPRNGIRPDDRVRACSVPQRDGRKGPPAGNKTRCKRTCTAQSKATQCKAKTNQKQKTHKRGAKSPPPRTGHDRASGSGPRRNVRAQPTQERVAPAKGSAFPQHLHMCQVSGQSRAPCVGLGCLVRLRFALHSLAMWRVCAIAPSFVSGWRAFSSVSLCKSVSGIWPTPSLAWSGSYPAWDLPKQQWCQQKW